MMIDHKVKHFNIFCFNILTQNLENFWSIVILMPFRQFPFYIPILITLQPYCSTFISLSKSPKFSQRFLCLFLEGLLFLFCSKLTVLIKDTCSLNSFLIHFPCKICCIHILCFIRFQRFLAQLLLNLEVFIYLYVLLPHPDSELP